MTIAEETTGTWSRLASWLTFRPWVLAAIGVSPFLCIPLAHLLADNQQATGLFQYELSYYVANGRAAFERGNGLLYPNPYDPSPDAPVIYAHWLPWMFGFCTTTLGIDPGLVVMIATAIAALLFGYVTSSVVRFLCPGSTFLPAYFLTIWGGGLLSLASLLLHHSPLTLDPGRGFWFLNWGRNCLLPTEAVYHSLVLMCWLAEWRQRKIASNVAVLLLATTHPWSGLQLLLTMNAWRLLICMRHWKFRSVERSDLIQFGFVFVVLAAFLAYYKIWLPSFPAHASLQTTWELDWSVTWTTAFFAWGPIAMIAVSCLVKKPASAAAEADARRFAASNEVRLFLLTAFVVALGLALHDRIIKPVQPLHFTRGYVWMPLCLLAISAGSQSFNHPKPKRITIAACLVGLFLITDNFVFCAVHIDRQLKQEDAFFLSHGERQLLTQLHNHSDTKQQIGITDSEDLNYLLPTYTGCRTWLGHHFNTPNYSSRLAEWEQWFTERGSDFAAIDPAIHFVAVRRTGIAHDPDPDQWQLVDLPNAEFEVWKRH